MTTRGSVPYRSGRSPEYRRLIRRSSSSVSPRLCVSRERSSAPSMNVARRRQFSSWRGSSASRDARDRPVIAPIVPTPASRSSHPQEGRPR